MKTYAAGILFKSGGKIFLVKRGDDGSWAVPGGKLEEGETPEAAAKREVLEECGFDYSAPLTPHTLIDGYVTYLADDAEQFDAVLNDENQACGWFSPDELPEPLHPGMVAMLDAEPLNEKDVAGLIAGGQLTSPQFFRNMYLWALRITGTGVTWRSKFRQYAYRSPENYLTDDFLARCSGLPVIWLHPEKNTLNSEEYAARTIGAIAFAWIQGEGVLNTNGATTVSLPADSRGNTTVLTYDHGEMAVFLLAQIQAIRTRTMQMGRASRMVILGPQRTLGTMEMQQIVQLTSYQRPGGGTSTVKGTVNGVGDDADCEIEWGYDDTLIGAGANGTDAIVIAMPEVERPEVNAKINTNEFARLSPSLEATSLMLCDMAAPREIPTPIAGGAIDVLSELRSTSGWVLRPEALTIISMKYSD